MLFRSYSQADTLKMITEAMGRCLRQEQDLYDVAAEMEKGSAVLEEDVLERLANIVAKSLRL